MKVSTTLALTACAGIVAFAVGHRSHQEPAPDTAAPAARGSGAPARPLPPRGSRDETAAAATLALGKYASCSKEFSASNAARLTSQERLELLANGALVGDYGNQAAMLCGLISVLTKDEIREAGDILGRIQDSGNSQAPEVWQSFWRQWGRLDPQGCLSFFGNDAVSKSAVDARNVMSGWLEMNADAALEWARQPGKAPLEAAAAALAISRGANGDLKQLEAAILKFPSGDPTAKACLEDYFDAATLTGKDQTAAEVYDALPPALRSAAWTTAAKRVGYGDTATAKAWVAEHAADPGRDYAGLYDLFETLMYEDMVGTAKWATQLPFSSETDRRHPALRPVTNWLQREPAAAEAWLKTQPPDAPWVPKIPR